MASEQDQHEQEWTASPEAKHLFRTLGRFTQNQEELLYIADYIVEKKSDMDDQKEQTRIYTARMFPNVEPHLFDELWDALIDMRERAEAEAWVDEEPDLPDAADVAAGGGESSTPGSSSGSAANDDSAKVAPAGQPLGNSSIGAEEVVATDSQSGDGNESDPGTEDNDAAFDSVLSRLPANCRFEYVTAVSRRINQERRHSPRVLSSLLTSVVADFEVMVGGLLRYAISRSPKLIESSERTYTWSDIASFSDLEKFKSAQIDKMVDTVLYGSFQSWLDYLAKRFGISATSLASAEETVEIFQRRNLVVHTGGQVSQQYLDNVAEKFQVKLDTALAVDVHYLQRASDTMLVMGVTLVCSAAAKMVKDDDSLRWLEEDITGGLVYNLLQAQRYWAVSEIIASLNLGSFKSKGAALRGQVNGWLALKRQDRLQECRRDIEEWDTSVLEPLFKLARAALLDDFEYAEALAHDLRGTPDLPILHYLTWPLLDELREYEREKAKRHIGLENEVV